ncbi:MAG: hypothetical protein IBX47_01070 [Desulfuromonadales bacterium]|nr:hypothetical protein [Desulfuromonadales bacterium]
MPGELNIASVNLPIITQRQLINRMNVLHFQDETLLVVLRHLVHDYTVHLRAAPLPTVDKQVATLWVKESLFPPDLKSYRLESIVIPGTLRVIEFFPGNYALDPTGMQFTLPEEASELFGRISVRHLCRQEGLKAALLQNSVSFSGQLIDFSPQALKVKLQATGPQNFFWLNLALPATLIITRDGSTLYSGLVDISSRDEESGNYKVCILKPIKTSTPRFQPKKHRSRREQFKPSPDLIFTHPLTGRKCTLKVELLGSLGLSVLEQERTSVLMAGLLLPEAELSFANSLCLKCTAQVVFRGATVKGIVKSGIALLDIGIKDHLKLISLIQQAQDSHAYVSNQVDPEALFEFFFETGFLYPHKYAEVAGNREEFKSSYLKIYEDGQDLCRHFIYQDNGQILGHFATIRTHRSTWMNQHHAALPDHRAGLKVIRAISEFINDSHFLNPMNLKYIIGFYRPENRFPNRFFGGFVHSANNNKITSLDEFAYCKQVDKIGPDRHQQSAEWETVRANPNDIAAFKNYYKEQSGGLMANAFDLDPGLYDDTTLTEIYSSAGLKRCRHFYAVRYNDSLKALIEIQESALGLNMSELTNAIIVYVVEQKALDKRRLQRILFDLAKKYKKHTHPLLIYPREYAEKQGFKIDKNYNLWTLDLRHTEHYMDWLYRYFRKS